MLKRLGLMLLLALALAGAGETRAKAEGAAEANAGLSACSSRSGKDLYNCVADVLDRFAAQQLRAPQRRTELMRAASGLRAAVNKAQALLALTQCQTVITTALKQASASGRRTRHLGGEEGLGVIAGVIAKAIRLVQAKG